MQRFDNANWVGALNWATQHTVIRPWWGFTLMGWIVQTAIFLVLALVAFELACAIHSPLTFLLAPRIPTIRGYAERVGGPGATRLLVESRGEAFGGALGQSPKPKALARRAGASLLAGLERL